MVSFFVLVGSVNGSGPPRVCGCPTCGQCSGGGGVHVSLQIFIFGGHGTVTINGTVVHNGTTVTNLIQTYDYTISASPSSGYDFRQWYSPVDNVINENSSSTVIDMWYSSLTSLTMVMNQSNAGSVAGNYWAGYYEGYTDIYYVSGTFSIPTVTWNYSATSTSEDGQLLSEWVGIGGVDGTGDIWQAGVSEWLPSPGTEVTYYWIEDYYANSNEQSTICFDKAGGTPPPGCNQASLTNVPDVPAANTTFSVAVDYWANPTGNNCLGHPCGNVTYSDTASGIRPTSPQWLYNTGYGEDFTASPDNSTADWIAEVPGAPAPNPGTPLYNGPTVLYGSVFGNETVKTYKTTNTIALLEGPVIKDNDGLSNNDYYWNYPLSVIAYGKLGDGGFVV